MNHEIQGVSTQDNDKLYLLQESPKTISKEVMRFQSFRNFQSSTTKSIKKTRVHWL